MYRIIDIRERKLSEYQGKIIQVIANRQEYIEAGIYSNYEWVLTCLVEELVEEKE